MNMNPDFSYTGLIFYADVDNSQSVKISLADCEEVEKSFKSLIIQLMSCLMSRGVAHREKGHPYCGMTQLIPAS